MLQRQVKFVVPHQFQQGSGGGPGKHVPGNCCEAKSVSMDPVEDSGEGLGDLGSETRKVQQAVGESPRESLRALVQSQQRFNKVLANIPEMVGAVLEQSKALLAIAFLDKSFDGAAEAYFGWDGLCKFIRCH